ncbi:TetR/AcrR family transcriptional regulator [Agrobacterium sp. rho-13.3]|uniref:TetR/AcrR family transcriptional regulator n=1 Tax=Agrobacterium sp. rho-13.3 TaxID=3072980 RepID=UPI002A137EB7|nr:TetR/AcrR family transcriptional regulator [Agrobacterium sp. rho-13.3]MDX8310076.1 TetR/AcrR family transcriptional regulator [Agrobacterium sp. rho-13.3]
MIVFYIASMTQQFSSSASTRQRGRPREFDVDLAVDKAIRVFSERGYHATSVGDLTQAMELTQGSLYKAFKDKKDIYIAAVERYKLVQTRRFDATVQTGKTGREKLRAAMNFYADASAGQSGGQGCLIVGAVADLVSLDDDMARVVRGAIEAREKALARFAREGQADGSVSKTSDADALAKTALCILYGMRVVGKTGLSRAQLAAVVDTAMKVFD